MIAMVDPTFFLLSPLLLTLGARPGSATRLHSSYRALLADRRHHR
jgi:hypothetical protein